MPHKAYHYHIVIVEDNIGDYLLIADYLEEKITHLRLTHTRSFKETADLFANNISYVDVILLDLSLPDKTGEALITEALQLAPNCPVIVLTGYSDLSFGVKSLSLGISDYLLKDDINPGILYKSMLYSIERNKSHIALLESEKRYSNLFHLSPQPMWVSDMETHAFLDVNDAAIRHYGYNKEEFLRITTDDINVPANGNTAEAIEAFLPGPGQHNGTLYARHLKKNGDTIYVQLQNNTLLYKGRKAEIILANDITELLKTQQSLRKAYKNTVDIEEQERQRLAGELHDGIAQHLVALKLIFSGIERKFPEIQTNQQRSLFYEMLENTLRECKEIVNKVRPKELVDKGLDAMLALLLERMNSLGKTQLKLHLHTPLDEHFEYADRFHLYRILQENINNTFKYADATEAVITVEKVRDIINITFADDGKGIDEKILLAPGSFLGIKRRISVLNGKFEVTSTAGSGVRFQYQIPLPQSHTS